MKNWGVGGGGKQGVLWSMSKWWMTSWLLEGGSAASEACLQASPLFPLPRLPPGSHRSPKFFFSPTTIFFSFFPQSGAWSQANLLRTSAANRCALALSNSFLLKYILHLHSWTSVSLTLKLPTLCMLSANCSLRLFAALWNVTIHIKDFHTLYTMGGLLRKLETQDSMPWFFFGTPRWLPSWWQL